MTAEGIRGARHDRDAEPMAQLEDKTDETSKSLLTLLLGFCTLVNVHSRGDMKQAIGYIRVSTAKQGKSGLGLEAQQQVLQRFADAESIQLVDVLVEVESAKPDASKRPVLAQALARAKRGKLPIVVAKLDRRVATCTTSAV